MSASTAPSARVSRKKKKKGRSKSLPPMNSKTRLKTSDEFKASFTVVRVNRNEQTTPCTCKPKQKKLRKGYYYDVLKLNTDASPHDIEIAYEREANRCQLLKGLQEGRLTKKQAEEMIEFNFAYRILGNPDRRKIYDRLGLRGVLFVEKYGGAKLLTWFFKTRLDGACFLIMSGLTCCYCFGFCFGFCCCCCCNQCCGLLKKRETECPSHGVVVSASLELPVNSELNPSSRRLDQERDEANATLDAPSNSSKRQK